MMFRKLILSVTFKPSSKFPRISCKRCCSLYDPPYLNKGPQPEKYAALNIRMRGYDFPMLESFSKYVHNLTKIFEIEGEAYPVPTRSAKVALFKPNSTAAAQEYELKLYERTVKMEQVSSVIAPLLMEVIQNTLPEGVEVTFKELEPEEEEFRYIPDTTLKDLRQQVESVQESIREFKSR
ncbi:hypothetical protein LSH36_204g08026 [Paralvinella palmiformis]|uniref:Small ribosomal subunit protein uS10 domain-containing protein n=1 Tax=Paralvinella palmiformis TaxID=53620 RepID=A0AAD9N7C4_9ANNE|nr:hypothetical protein LSH36_204g08026 [Paralvinella palmiformis]